MYNHLVLQVWDLVNSDASHEERTDESNWLTINDPLPVNSLFDYFTAIPQTALFEQADQLFPLGDLDDLGEWKDYPIEFPHQPNYPADLFDHSESIQNSARLLGELYSLYPSLSRSARLELTYLLEQNKIMNRFESSFISQYDDPLLRRPSQRGYLQTISGTQKPLFQSPTSSKPGRTSIADIESLYFTDIRAQDAFNSQNSLSNLKLKPKEDMMKYLKTYTGSRIYLGSRYQNNQR